MKCKDCTEDYCPHRTSDATKECYYYAFAEKSSKAEMYSKVSEEDVWKSVRIKAAIAAMQALIGILDNVYDRNLISTPKLAVEFADALIAELKKGE